MKTLQDMAGCRLPENCLINRADCLDYLKTLPDDSVDLIATDPPYFRVKPDDWDRQWKGQASFFEWLSKVLEEYQRVLKPTGSIYLFCGPYLASQTEILMGKYFKVLNHIVWRKPQGRHLGCNKESLTKYFPQTERIIFAESLKKRAFPFESIREHLAGEVKAAGISSKKVNEATGTQMSGHWFGRSQFAFPSKEHYSTMQALGAHLKPYEELKAEYVMLRRRHGLRGRYFGVTKHVPYTDVWDFATVKPRPGKHPCEKPLELMDHIIESSSRPGDVVLDAFLGSGSTAVSALNLGRVFWGCEKGDAEFLMVLDRLRNEC